MWCAGGRRILGAKSLHSRWQTRRPQLLCAALSITARSGAAQLQALVPTPSFGVDGSLTAACSKPHAASLFTRPDMAMRYLSQEEAIAVDTELMATPGFSIDQLMELAGLACAGAIADAFPISDGHGSTVTVLVVAGPGNNGGDGLVAARHLYQFGYKVSVVYPKQNKKELFTNLVQQVKDVGIPVLDTFPLHAQEFDVVVDAVFGFSFKPPLRAPFSAVLAEMVKLPSGKLVSIDIPSGWDVERGALESSSAAHLLPDVLISLTWPKQGVAAWAGRRHYLGGRFVPPGLAEKYQIKTSGYTGSRQFRVLDAEENTAPQTEVMIVWITAPESEADGLVKAIILSKLAACVNKINSVESTYMWQGKVETGTEALMMAKSTAAKLPELIAFVEQTHSYDVPETIATRIVGGNAAYLKWVASSLE